VRTISDERSPPAGEMESPRRFAEQETRSLGQAARRTAVITLVAVGIIVVALAVWKLRLVVALVFSGMILAAAMRPAIEWLARHHVPRPAGLALHYLAFFGVIAVTLAFAVPRALDQVNHALSPSGKAEIAHAARNSTGVKHQVLVALQKRLRHLPRGSALVKPATQLGPKSFEILIGIFFTLAVAAYWIFERDRAVDTVCSLLPRPKRKLIRDTWTLIDLRLGAFVRGQSILIFAVGITLSLLFWAVGEPYWLLIGAFAGLVEIIPVVGPLIAGALAVAVGLTSSVHVAVLAAACVLAVRLLEDYLIMPRVLGDAVGLSPLLLLVSVTTVGILFSPWAILLAVPIAAVAVTLFDVVVRNVDPAEEEVPSVIFTPNTEDA
jgi:predicted PurR-regulated permease PerM